MTRRNSLSCRLCDRENIEELACAENHSGGGDICSTCHEYLWCGAAPPAKGSHADHWCATLEALGIQPSNHARDEAKRYREALARQRMVERQAA